MTAAVMAAPRFDMGRVVKRTFEAIGRNLPVFGLLAVLLAGIPEAIAIAGQVAAEGAGASSSTSFVTTFASGNVEAGLLQAIGGIARFVGTYVLQAALIHGVVADLNGRKASFGDCLSTGFRFFWPVLAIAILTGIALVFGFILLIVPGVLMALAWTVNVPVEVVERTGVFGAFGRSADLTRNHRWAILGLALIYFILAAIVSAAVLALTGVFNFAAVQHGLSATTLGVTAALNVIESLIGAAGVAAIYYELRSIKEGVGPEALAAVFD